MGSFDSTLATGIGSSAVAGEPVAIGHWIAGQVAAPAADARYSPVYNPATGAVGGQVVKLLGRAELG
ncbi:MAG: hypothetical protein EHM83_14815, partial [Burkholderiales bacterium]